MLLLTYRSPIWADICTNPLYESRTTIYDYSQAEMHSRDGNGFVWDKVQIDTYLVLKVAPKFICITSIVTKNSSTFAELIKGENNEKVSNHKTVDVEINKTYVVCMDNTNYPIFTRNKRLVVPSNAEVIILENFTKRM